jgi:hypothetical protein
VVCFPPTQCPPSHPVICLHHSHGQPRAHEKEGISWPTVEIACSCTESTTGASVAIGHPRACAVQGRRSPVWPSWWWSRLWDRARMRVGAWVVGCMRAPIPKVRRGCCEMRYSGAHIVLMQARCFVAGSKRDRSSSLTPGGAARTGGQEMKVRALEGQRACVRGRVHALPAVPSLPSACVRQFEPFVCDVSHPRVCVCVHKKC